MYVLGGMSVALQLFCVLHVLRQGRNQMWVWVILLFSVMGCLAYFMFEVFPTLGFNRQVRQVKTATAARLDPERELRQARDALDLADTAAAWLRAADAYAGLGRHDDAASAYRHALDRMPNNDRRTRARLATSLFEGGDPRGALRELDSLPEGASGGEADRLALLRARVLEALGRSAEAEVLLNDVVTRMPGDEVRCRLAALRVAGGDRDGAEALLAEVTANARRLPKLRRMEERAMYDWAETTLAELRGG